MRSAAKPQGFRAVARALLALLTLTGCPHPASPAPAPAATASPAIPDVVMYLELAPGADGLAALVPAVPPSRAAVQAEIAASTGARRVAVPLRYARAAIDRAVADRVAAFDAWVAAGAEGAEPSPTFDEALWALDVAAAEGLRTAPADDVPYLRAWIFTELGREPEATAALTQLLDGFPDSARRGEAHLRRCELAMRRGDWRAARDDGQAVFQVRPALPPGQANMARYFQAFALRNLGDDDAAVRTFAALLDALGAPPENGVLHAAVIDDLAEIIAGTPTDDPASRLDRWRSSLGAHQDAVVAALRHLLAANGRALP